jgi:equilibrative nucleoside transporter 1/2/3
VKYYRSIAASEGCKTVSADLAAGGIQTIPKGVLFLSSVLVSVAQTPLTLVVS